MLSVQITFLNGMDSGFTFLLAARKRECFFETLKVNMSLDLEYQVYKYFVDFLKIISCINTNSFCRLHV